MSMSIALAIPGTSVIATDRRWRVQRAGANVAADIGGKLIRTRSGWLTFTGKGATNVIRSTLERVDADGLHTEDEVAGALRAVVTGKSASLGECCHLILARGDSPRVARVSWEIGTVHVATGAYVFSTPFASAEEHGAASAGLRERLRSARSTYDIVRSIARAFSECADVSREVEMGVGDAYLRGRSDDIAAARDRWIETALNPLGLRTKVA